MAQDKDRYITFTGLDCEERATRFMQRLYEMVEEEGEGSKWRGYFAQKFDGMRKMGQDDLYFIGSQMNALYGFLESREDEGMQKVLWDIEQECC
ncbi:N(2)-fixation sustaining protein CowN [Magnetofaba australis]|uniref:N(2)-fixation sustaining protein CowN n=1 Tax=Magnetofaba australis IT-1 TaxID=1434232 RepID=A0A1Y2K7X0_9PROT|nr:N(2)-fixation sustaining protein CowN [Magnetofaba australis]OSM06840.1 hypothetical protein MAIT1_00286 [Magnetofaba australis IT-1]